MKFSDLSSPEFFENPYPLYEKIRDEGAFVSLSANSVLTGRYAVADALLHDRRMGKAYMKSVVLRYGETAREQPVFQALSRTFLMLNPPTHTRLRALLMKAFNARQIEKLRDISQSTAEALIDAIARAPDVDLMKDYALPLPVTIICRLLDIPIEDGHELGSAASRMVQALDAAPIGSSHLARANEATLTLERYFEKAIETRRTKPGNDLVSALILAEEAGETLTNDEIVSNLLLLFTAGHETTSNMLGNALIALHRHPEQLRRLRRDPSLMPAAVSECMRYDSSVQVVVRVALEDVQLGEQALPRDTVVFVMLGAANRDPAQYHRPDELDIGRSAQGRSLSFSAGIHYCLGARLALLELEVGLGALFSRLPKLRLTGLDALQWQQRSTLRGVESLAATY